MARDRRETGEAAGAEPSSPRPAAGKRTRTERLVQRRAFPEGGTPVSSAGATAEPAVAADPFDWTAITGPFVQHGGGHASEPAAIHAAAEQQRGGVPLAGGVSAGGDPYEREADAIADDVVRGEQVGARLGTGAARSSPSVQRKETEGDPPALWGWVEPQLKAFLLIPVPDGDLARAKMRVDLMLGTLHALHRAQRKLLSARLEHPRAGDELAELFQHQLSRGSRKRILAVLRDETPASTEEHEDKPDTAGAGDDHAATGSGATAATGSKAMWQQVVGERSTPVGKMARVRAPRGVRLRTRPAAGEADIGILRFDELVQVERRTEHGWCWVVSMGADAGKTGFCEEQFLSIDPPEPTAHLYRVAPGDTLGGIAERYYGKSFRGGNDARLYVQALHEANKDHEGVYLDKVELDRSDTWHRDEDEEKTLEVYRGAKVREGLAIWVPSEAFIQQLKASGAITSGSSELSKAWRKAKDVVGDVIDGVKYAAGFIVGLLEGSWDAIVDLFQGAADLVEAVAKVVYHLVTGNPGAIKDMLMGWVDKLKLAWANRDKIADEFMKKWEAADGWDRGRFQGEVLGWVMMTALIAIVTSGAGAAPMMAGKWASVLRVLKTVDALGDVTAYAGKAARLPGKAYDVVTGKLGRGAGKAEDAAEDAVDAAGDAAGDVGRSSGKAGETITVSGHAQSPRLKWAKNPDGAVRSVEEAVEIARRHGVDVSDDVLLRKVSGKALPKDTHAMYLSKSSTQPQNRIGWDEFFDKDLDQILVRVESSVFESDEAIVAILGHEMHELSHLHRLFDEAGGSMTYQRLHYLISPGIKGNLHDGAWDIADQLVMNMRKGAKQ